MSRKFGLSALACVGLLGLGALPAQAQITPNNVQSQTFPFSGTCTGGNEVIGTPPISLTNATTSAAASSATITIGDIVLVGLASSSIQYAQLAISGNAGTILVWLGPGQTHVTTTVGSAGNVPVNTSGVPIAAQAVGNGVFLPDNGGLNLTVACTTGTWQAYATIWYHTP
jgi:hypothetical protein